MNAARDVVQHALLTLRRTPGRALAFGMAAFLAAGLLSFGLTDAASRQDGVTGAFDSLAARRVQVTLPLRGSPYQSLDRTQLAAIASLPGVTGIAWGARRDAHVVDADGALTTTRLWTLDGDLSLLGLRTSGTGDAGRGLLVGGGSPVAEQSEERFYHAVIDGRRVIVGGTFEVSPAIPDLLEAVAVPGAGEPPSMRAEGELVVGVRPGWATEVAPRLATMLAPGREASVLVRYPPEASELRRGVLSSVDSLVLVASAAILALGAGAVMIGMYFRVLSERRLLGLYRAIGASSGFVVATILVEAVIIGSLGSVLGAVVGLGAASARALIQGTALAVPWVLVGAGVIAGLLTNALGALLPAVSTVREQPLRSLRSR